jgi:hypothetical protein
VTFATDVSTTLTFNYEKRLSPPNTTIMPPLPNPETVCGMHTAEIEASCSTKPVLPGRLGPCPANCTGTQTAKAYATPFKATWGPGKVKYGYQTRTITCGYTCTRTLKCN